jgi:hypothetical protein
MSEPMILEYRGRQFEFLCTEPDAFTGRFVLNPGERELLASLLDSEEEWFLDRNGERLPDEELFLRSPWSLETPNGSIKILSRLINAQTGEARFSTSGAYGGEFFKWLRHGRA